MLVGGWWRKSNRPQPQHLFLDYDQIPREPRLFLERCNLSHRYHALGSLHIHINMQPSQLRNDVASCIVLCSSVYCKRLHCESFLHSSEPHKTITGVASSQLVAAADTHFCTRMQPGLRQGCMCVRNLSA